MPVRYRRAATVVWRHSNGRVLARPVGDDEVVVLTDSGQDLWELLIDQPTLDEIAIGLAGTYGASAAQVRADIEPVLADLVTRGIVERTRPA